MLRYALLKDLGNDVKVVQVRNEDGKFENLEMNEEAFIRRLKARVHEEALLKMSIFKKKLTIEEIHECLDRAVISLLHDEIKSKSVSEKK